MAGTLYMVSTPIGNLEDITLRALRILKEVDLIAAEDTRQTRKLLTHYAISTSMISYYDQVESSKAPYLVDQLRAGKSIALLSDSGTPTLSDPGFRLVKEAIQAGIPVVPVPGPSAMTAVLSASGLPTDRFLFEGFLPAKGRERKEKLRRLKEKKSTIVFFEAPHRLKECLQDLLEILGDREVVIGREVTKIHEEFLRGRLSKIVAEIGQKEPRGEFTLVVRGAEREGPPAKTEIMEEIRRLKGQGLRVKEIAELLGERFSYSKREIYRLTLEGAAKDKVTS